MVLEPPGQFPSHSRTKSLFKLYRKRPWGLLGSFPQTSLLMPYLNSIENGLGASSAVSLTWPHEISIAIRSKIVLEPPGRFPSDFLIKSRLKLFRKWPWSLLGSLLHIPVCNLSYNSIENASGASWVAS